VNQSDPTAADITRLQDASDWVQRLNESSAAELADQWMQWCGADPKNLPAFEQMQRLWDAFPEAQAKTAHPSPGLNRPRLHSRLMALAAGIVLIVGVAAWFALRYSDDQVLETSVGEQRRIALADGSRLDLAPDSLVSTHFTLARRDVRLMRGQAFFAVAHSAVRPFVVHANTLTVTAVGTEFDVRISPSSTAVIVGQGRVTVVSNVDGAGSDSPSNAEIVRATVGQRVAFSNVAQRLNVATVDPKAAGAWRDGTLQFVGEPLEDVVSAINRYTAPQIVVAPAFHQTRFTGTVSPSRVRDWLEAMEQIYAVEVVDQGANGILIRGRTHGIQK
jgi:transmembrane sensor